VDGQYRGVDPSVPSEVNGNCGVIKSNQSQALLWMYFLRVPLNGATFAQTTLRYGCPEGLYSDDVAITEPSQFLAENEVCKGKFHYMAGSYPSYPWYLLPFNVVLMMRNTIDRLASGFVKGFVDCPAMYRAVSCPGVQQNVSNPKYMYSQVFIRCIAASAKNAVGTESVVLQYGECVRGMVTNTLGGGVMPERVAGDVIVRDEITEKMEKRATYVIDKAAFVGLTESFDVSVCLFHAKFGGPVADGEFLRATPPLRVARQAKATVASTLKSNNFADYHDDKLYSRAKIRFFKEKKTYLPDWTGVVAKKRLVGKKRH
jgi:hypothetical protein